MPNADKKVIRKNSANIVLFYKTIQAMKNIFYGHNRGFSHDNEYPFLRLFYLERIYLGYDNHS